ncbi:MAG: flagellar motor switch protein FliM [Fimbriimonadaceae bacterium]|nr:flagellar motor switch protein FliM [Fimbriimonadaceae bacterium]
MSEILSQSEIEALLASLNDGGPADLPAAEDAGAPGAAPAAGGQPAAATGKPGTKPTSLSGFAPPARQSARTAISYEVYDFRRPDKFSKDQLRTLQMLHETFARMAGSALSAFLRTPVNIDLISLEQVPYEEYLRSINQSVFTVMSLPPLSGQAVLEVEFSLIFSMIDRLLGGPGKAIHRTVLTDIERPLVRQNIERMFSALKSAWEGIVVVNPSIEGLETSAQFVQIAPPNDIVVTILFEVKLGTQRGAMSLCIPYLLLKPITTKLSAQKWFATGSRKVSQTTRRMLSAQVSQANVDCMISLGGCRLNIKDFLKLQPGDVLRLGQKTRDDLNLYVGGIPKYEGKPALQGKKLVFTVSGVKED